MIVYYRLCDRKSPLSKPSPILNDNLLKLTEICLRSFVDVYKKINPEMVFIADYCPLSYDRMIKEVVPFKYKIIHTQKGINETCLMQYRLFEASGHDVVLFQEYDYLWVKPLTERMIGELGFVSPYDHPDKYPHINTSVALADKHFFITVESTTATFATDKKAFSQHKDLFYRYGYIDKERWQKLSAPLFSPIPSFATHMVDEFMAPVIDWKAVWSKYI